MVAVVLSTVVPAVAGSVPAGAVTAGPSMTTTPTSGLEAGQPVGFTVRNEPPGTALVAVECTPQALSVGENACDNRRNALVFADSSGTAEGTLVPSPEIRTALGTTDCTGPHGGCLFAVASVAGDGSASVVGVQGLGFAPGVTATSRAGRSTGPPAPFHMHSRVRLGGPTITAGHPLTVRVRAGTAPRLTAADAVTGPALPAPATPAPARSVRGQGVIEVTLAAPGTSWGYAGHRAVVVDVSVDGGPSQNIVCFAGSSPFTYAGFTGTLGTGDHSVTVAVDPTLSQTGSLRPTVRLVHLQLMVVTPSNPRYAEVADAPVVYGRADTARDDTPLLTYADSQPGHGGVRSIAYTTIWSKEAAGTSFIPFLEWGEWGRMTDITGTVVAQVDAAGTISSETYDSCGCKGTAATENAVSLIEKEVPFSGAYFQGTHAVVRNASGNDYQAPTGTTPFRIQQVPVPGPAPGASRASVMDAHPWTYLVSAQECSRWYTDFAASPSSPQIGDARQYAIVDLGAQVHDVRATAVAIRLQGASRWYLSDLGSGYPLHDGGHGRTAVKLPMGWQDRRITGIRLLAYPAGPEPSVRHVSVGVLGLTPSFTIERARLPAVHVVQVQVP
jgi:hypothetical protein